MAQQTENESILKLSKEEIGKILILNPEPFSVTFSWKNQYVKVKLNNGEDILKLGELLSNYLTENGIKNTIEHE